MLRRLGLVISCVAVTACGGSPGGNDGDGGNGNGPDAAGTCWNLQCNQNLTCPGGGHTRLQGTVYTPAGDLPLPNIQVFVPNGALAAFPTELTCDRCGANVSGDPLTSTVTGIDGTFSLDDVPSGIDFPLVIQNGRWRRAFTIPKAAITDCGNNPVPVGMVIRLPQNHTEGDIPRIAVTTGNADALDCLILKMGIAPQEIGTAGDTTRRVHFYTSNGANKFSTDPGFTGANLASATTWWGTDAEDVDTVILPRLKAYDIIIHSCEGDEFCGGGRCAAGTYPSNKPSHALQAFKKYNDQYGRSFMSHFHHTWIEYNPAAEWRSWLTWNNSGHASDLGTGVAFIDLSFEKGRLLNTWLLQPTVGGAGPTGRINLTQMKKTATAITNPTQGERWVYTTTADNGYAGVEYVAGNTPIGAQPADQCGRMVFTDIHVSAGRTSKPATPYPGGCNTSTLALTEQEKALIYMMFDLAACVGPVIP